MQALLYMIDTENDLRRALAMCSAVGLTKYDHPTQKPVDPMLRPILNHLKRGGLVFDPFLGSGTTLAAAELTERVCVGIEHDPNVDVIIQRYQTLSGKKASLDGDGRTFDVIAEERRREPA